MGWEVFLPDRFIEPLENKIHEIAGSIETCVPTDGGLMGGAAGLACFSAYYAAYTGKQRFEMLAAELLELSLRPAAGSFPGYSFCDGMAGIAWMIHHLKATQLPWLEVSGVFEFLDEAIYKAMMAEIRSGHFDYLHGALGMALYFLRDPQNENCRQVLSELIQELDNQAEKMSDGSMKWPSMLDHENNHIGYNLSLSHGLASIIIIVSQIRQIGVEISVCDKVIHGSMLYLDKQKLDTDKYLSCYPSWAIESSQYLQHSRLAWCYGDPGIGLAYCEAGRSNPAAEFYQKGMDILEHSGKRREVEENLVRDAGICHGAAGLAMMYNYWYQKSARVEFREAAMHWLDVCLNMAFHTNGPAGYRAKRAKEFGDWEDVHGLLEGVAGIGLVMLSFLSNEDPSWMKAFLLS